MSSSRVRIKGNENEGNYLPSFFYKSNVVIVIRIALGFCLQWDLLYVVVW
jgi:hypothetical protein